MVWQRRRSQMQPRGSATQRDQIGFPQSVFAWCAPLLLWTSLDHQNDRPTAQASSSSLLQLRLPTPLSPDTEHSGFLSERPTEEHGHQTKPTYIAAPTSR